MNWKKEAENELRLYKLRREAIKNISEKIHMLEERFVSIKGISSDTPVMGGESRMEYNMINNIVERERLKNNLSVVERIVKLTEKGLAGLDNRQKTVLDVFFINRTPDYIDRLCNTLNLERAQIYRIKDEAIYKFTVTMYGIIDL